VLGPAAGEAAQHLVRLGGLQAQRRRVLDHLVVVAGDQVPVDGLARQHVLQLRPPLVLPEPGPVEPGRPDVLQPGQQPEIQQMRESESDD